MEVVGVDRLLGIPEQEICKIDKSFFASKQATDLPIGDFFAG